jgi:hypothetical protein
MARKTEPPIKGTFPKPDCLKLLEEFVKVFETIPQKYCLFCEANAALGLEAHKADCPYLQASNLIAPRPSK